MQDNEKEIAQDQWTRDEVPIIVATIAFGMGINKPDVRFVIHCALPKTLEGYMQESGRAGRDGGPAQCILYYCNADFVKLLRMIKDPPREPDKPPPKPEQVRLNEESLKKMLDFAQEPYECRRVMMLRHFGEDFDEKDCKGTCDNCRNRKGSVVGMVDKTSEALPSKISCFFSLLLEAFVSCTLDVVA